MRKLSTVLKIVVSAAILVFVFRKANLSSGLERLEQIRLPFLLLSILLIIAGQVVRAQRLAVMLFGEERKGRLWAVLRIQMVSFLPGVISPAKVGEVTKVFMLQSELDVPTERGLLCFVAERVYDLLLLSPLAAIGLYVFYRDGLDIGFEAGWTHLLVLALGVFAAALAALFVGMIFARSRGISFSNLWRTASPKGMIEAGVWTTLYWVIVLLEVWCFCGAAAFDARAWHMALVVPPSLLSSLLPITFSGFGIRELAMTILLQRPPIGAGYEQALLVSLMYDIIGLGIPALMGVFFWVARKQDGASQT